MTFKRCQIGNVDYGDDDKVGTRRNKHKGTIFKDDFDDPSLSQDLFNEQNQNREQIREFLTMLATCHTGRIIYLIR